MPISWHTEQRQIADLAPWPDNPRRILDKPFKNLQKSISKFGLAEPIAIQPDGKIIGGHARIEALKAAGTKIVDCYVPDRELTEKEYGELVIRLNKNVAGEFDFDKLGNLFDTEELIDWGFDPIELGMNTDESTDDTQIDGDAKEIVCPQCGAKFTP